MENKLIFEKIIFQIKYSNILSDFGIKDIKFSFLQDICTQMGWDSLRLNELPYLGYDEPDCTDEITLGNMPDLVMQCIFESFNLRDRCIASQVYIVLLNRFYLYEIGCLRDFYSHNQKILELKKRKRTDVAEARPLKISICLMKVKYDDIPDLFLI